MYSRCYFWWSGDIANRFGDASPRLRRCFGDASATSWDIGRHRECCKKIQCMHWKFRDALPRFCLEKWSAMHRRCIAECSAMHRRTLLNKFYFPKHPRGIGDASAMYRRSIRDASGMHPRIFVKHIWGICILRLLAVHACVDTRIEKTCQLLHRRCNFPSGTITWWCRRCIGDASAMHRRSIPEVFPNIFLLPWDAPWWASGVHRECKFV